MIHSACLEARLLRDFLEVATARQFNYGTLDGRPECQEHTHTTYVLFKIAVCVAIGTRSVPNTDTSRQRCVRNQALTIEVALSLILYIYFIPKLR